MRTGIGLGGLILLPNETRGIIKRTIKGRALYHKLVVGKIFMAVLLFISNQSLWFGGSSNGIRDAETTIGLAPFLDRFDRHSRQIIIPDLHASMVEVFASRCALLLAARNHLTLALF